MRSVKTIPQQHPIDRTATELAAEENEDSEYRMHVLHGEITWEMVGNAITQIYDSYLQEHYKKLVLIIMSPGGDTDAAWSLYTTLKNIGCEVVTLANGRLYSAALIPFLAGTTRYAFKESVFLFHPSTITSTRDEERPGYKINEEMIGDKLDNKIFREALISAGVTDKKIISKLTHTAKSTFLLASAAREFGLITDIIKSIDDIPLS